MSTTSRRGKFLMVGLGGLALVGVTAIGAHAWFLPSGVPGSVWEIPSRQDPEELRLFVVGDTGSGNGEQRAVAAAMDAECVRAQPDAVILLGDNFYGEGVSGTGDPQWQSKFADVYDLPCLKHLPFAAVLGNHDYQGRPQAQIDKSKEWPQRWIMPDRAFVVSAPGLVNIAMVDSNVPDRCALGLCSLDRLVQSLKMRPEPWTVVAAHHPLFSGGKYRRMSSLRRFFVGHFYCDVGATMYWSGHDHNLQVLRGRDDDLPCEVTQVISGAGGAALYPAEILPGLSEFAATVHGFAVVTFRKERAVLSFYGAGGTAGAPEANVPLHTKVFEK